MVKQPGGWPGPFVFDNVIMQINTKFGGLSIGCFMVPINFTNNKSNNIAKPITKH